MMLLVVFGLFLHGCNGLRMVDLSYDLHPGAITWPFNPRFNMSVMYSGFWKTHIWLENNRLDLAEHTGTHVDAPNHVAAGVGPWNNHQIPIERLGGPGVIIDVKDKAEANNDYRVTIDDLKTWEQRNGKIPYGAVVLMNSGWQKYYPDYSAVFKTDNISDDASYHFPSWHETAINWLVTNRVVYCVGGDTPSTDYGQSRTFPVHLILSKENIIGIESAAYLERLPESGSTIFVPVLKIRDGSGGPARMFATLPDDDGDKTNKAGTLLISPTLQFILLLLVGVLYF